jgi:hypothetical protein
MSDEKRSASGSSKKRDSFYPEVAYLYDPPRGGSASFVQTSSADNSRTFLIPGNSQHSNSTEDTRKLSTGDMDDARLGPIDPTSPLLVAPLSNIHHYNDHDQEHDLETSDHTTPITPVTPVLPPPPRYPSLKMPRLTASPSIPLPPPPPPPPPPPERALSPMLFSPGQPKPQQRDSWKQTEQNAWTASPLLAPQVDARANSSYSASSAGGFWRPQGPQTRASRGPSWLSPAIMSELQPKKTPPPTSRSMSSHSKAAMGGRSSPMTRPLTAIIDDERSST